VVFGNCRVELKTPVGTQREEKGKTVVEKAKDVRSLLQSTVGKATHLIMWGQGTRARNE
jgi:hypothetical protein